MISEKDFENKVKPEMDKLHKLLLKLNIPHVILMDLGGEKPGTTNVSIGASINDEGMEPSDFLETVLIYTAAIIQQMGGGPGQKPKKDDVLFMSNQVGRA